MDHSNMDHSSMDHSNMDHGSMGLTNGMNMNMDNDHDMDNMEHNGGSTQHMMHQGMMMYFHGGYEEVILFDFWRISSLQGLIGSMVICFIMGFLLEGLKCLRNFIISKEVRPQQSTVSVSNEEAVDGHSNKTGCKNSENVRIRKTKEVLKIIKTNIISSTHFIQTVLHLMQFVLSYFLMLIFMTYNSWLALATALGVTLGYFAFGWKRAVIVEVENCC